MYDESIAFLLCPQHQLVLVFDVALFLRALVEKTDFALDRRGRTLGLLRALPHVP